MKAGDEITWSYQIGSHPESPSPPPVSVQPDAYVPVVDPASPVDPIVPVDNHQTSPVQLSVPVVDVEDEPGSPVQLSVPFVVDVEDETPPSPVPVQPHPFPTALFNQAPTGDEFFQTQFRSPRTPIPELLLDRNLALESRRNELRQHLTTQLGQTIVFTASEHHAQEFGDCPVCQEKFQQNDTIRMQSCLHKFHDACLMECYTRYIEELINSSDPRPLAQVNFKCPVCKTTTQGQGELGLASRIQRASTGAAEALFSRTSNIGVFVPGVPSNALSPFFSFFYYDDVTRQTPHAS